MHFKWSFCFILIYIFPASLTGLWKWISGYAAFAQGLCSPSSTLLLMYLSQALPSSKVRKPVAGELIAPISRSTLAIVSKWSFGKGLRPTSRQRCGMVKGCHLCSPLRQQQSRIKSGVGGEVGKRHLLRVPTQSLLNAIPMERMDQEWNKVKQKGWEQCPIPPGRGQPFWESKWDAWSIFWGTGVESLTSSGL